MLRLAIDIIPPHTSVSIGTNHIPTPNIRSILCNICDNHNQNITTKSIQSNHYLINIPNDT